MTKRDVTSNYNKAVQEPDEPESNKCPAHGCMLAASMFLDGGPWACRYHAKQPTENWQKITAILHAQRRLLDIIDSADKIQPHEFDMLRDADKFELEDLLKPAKAGKGYPAETLKGWRIRVREFVYLAIQREIGKIETKEKPILEREISSAVAAFTGGNYRKQPRAKTFKSMAENRNGAE